MKGKLLFLAVATGLLLPALLWAGDWGFKGSKPITLADHLQHPQSAMNYMEQWSGTVVFGKDHNLNFNLVHSNLTTSGDKAVFRVEYNTPDGNKLEDSKRCSIEQSSSPFKLSCGGNLITGSPEEMMVRFKSDKISLAMSIKAVAPAFRPGNGRLTHPKNGGDWYDFMLTIPRGKALAKLNDKVLKGYGSVDHSYTNAGVHKVAKHWIRTTYHDEKVSILFAANIADDKRTTGWMSVSTDTASFSSADLNLELADNWQDKDKGGYYAPATIRMSAPGGQYLKIENMRFNSRRDMLSDLSKVEQWVVRKFSDPMRYSFGGMVHIGWAGGDSPALPPSTLPETVREVVVLTKQMDK